MFQSVGDYAKAQEYFSRVLGITKEIGDKKMEALAYGNLGTAFNPLVNMPRLTNISREHLA